MVALGKSNTVTMNGELNSNPLSIHNQKHTIKIRNKQTDFFFFKHEGQNEMRTGLHIPSVGHTKWPWHAHPCAGLADGIRWELLAPTTGR